MKETVTQKAQRLLVSGNVRITSADETVVVAKVAGDTSGYQVWGVGEDFRCSCPNRKNQCSHIEAVKKIWNTTN